MADADTDRQQVQQRLGEAGEEDHPLAPVCEHVSLDDVQEERRHCASFLVNVRVPQSHPAATHAASTTTCPIAGPTSIDPVVAPRHSSTPCHSGERTESGRRAAGSCEIGKNVPENRNSGITPSRMINGKRASVSWLAENAVSGAANAAAHNAAAGTAAMPHGEGTAPRTAATARKID